MRAALAAMLCAAAQLARAQEATDPHDAQPERPTVATHAFTVARGWTELESGLEWDRIDSLRVFSTPTTLKLGLASHLQVEATTAFIRQSDGSATSQAMGDLVLALKWRLADSLPVLGAFAIQPSVRLPTGTPVLGNGATVGELLFISSNKLGPVELDVNGGLLARLNDRETAPPTATLWTCSAGSQVYGPLGWTLEVYGFPATSGAAGGPSIIGLLTGPTWNVHPWFVLDGGIVVPLGGPQPHSVYAGLTWNMGRLWGPAPTSTSR